MTRTSIQLRWLNPLRWTVITWFAVLAWSWGPLAMNLPPNATYQLDPVTGRVATEPTRYKSLRELPVRVGWPLLYVRPDESLRTAPLLAGAAPPPRGPARVSVLAMIANAALILPTIAAAAVLLQAYVPRFSLRALLAVPLVAVAYFIGARLVLLTFRHLINRHWAPLAVECYTTAVYFAPLVLLITITLYGWPRPFPRSAEPANPASKPLEAADGIGA